MITLGIVLLIVSMFTNVAILQSIGVLLIVVGVVLFLLGSMGRAVGGRRQQLWRSPEAAISLFQQTRFGTAELLRQCDRQSWSRTATHPELGRLALADMLRIGVEHVDTHVAQIAALRHRS